jgi:hypothetical protein
LCAKPFVATPSSVDYYITDAGTTKYYGFSVTTCDGVTFLPINTVRNVDSTALSDPRFNWIAANTTLVVVESAANFGNSVGTQPLALEVNYFGTIHYAFIKVNFIVTTYGLTPTTPNHTISQCSEKIYPFTFGHTGGDVQALYSGID